MRIRLASLEFAQSPEAAFANVMKAVQIAVAKGVEVVCTPENYIPGQRGAGYLVEASDSDFLAHAERCLVRAAADAGLTIIDGTERVASDGLRSSALVVAPHGVLG